MFSILDSDVSPRFISHALRDTPKKIVVMVGCRSSCSKSCLFVLGEVVRHILSGPLRASMRAFIDFRKRH